MFDNLHNLSRDERWLLEHKYTGEATPVFWEDCKRLRLGEPLDYVIGWSEFLGHKLDLSLHPLIPRPETEYWVSGVLDKYKDRFDVPLKVLDIFAGSGCIGVACLSKAIAWHVDFVDKSLKCLEQIKFNCKLNGIGRESYNIIHSDLFNNLGNVRYDLILANPPYIPSGFQSEDFKETVSKYEPHEALFGGEDGLEVIFNFLKQVPRFLANNGMLAMEFGLGQEIKIANFLKDQALLTVNFYEDQYGRVRWLTAFNKV